VKRTQMEAWHQSYSAYIDSAPSMLTVLVVSQTCPYFTTVSINITSNLTTVGNCNQVSVP
jgi:hypothetical protein